MSIFNSVLSNVSQIPDVDNLAAKVGLSPEMVEKAIAALAAAHTQPGDTVDTAAAQTGVDGGTMSQIVDHIGGEGSLGAFAQMVKDNPEAQGLLGKLGSFF